jgi:acetyl esterase/lipase
MASLAIDLRGHGRSGGNGADLPAMIGDVQAAVGWLAAQQSVRHGGVAIVGASIGANLAAIVAADSLAVTAVALISPSLDYRGVRIDATRINKLGDRPVWLAASSEDPYALRTIKELAGEGVTRQQRVSSVRAHGTALLYGDNDLAGALVDWLRRTLIF